MPWYVIALISALFAGFYEIVEKKVLFREYTLFFLLTSFSLMFILSLPMIPMGQVGSITSEALLYIFVKCIFAVALFVLSAKAIKHMDISEFGPLMNLSPLALLIPAIFFLGENLNLMKTTGVLMIVGGAYVVELKDGWRTPIVKVMKDKYVHFVLLGVIFSSLAAIMDKFILPKLTDVNTFFFYNRMFIALLLLAAYFIFRDKTKKDKLVETFKRSFWWIFIASVLFMVTDYVYFTAVAVPVAFIALVIPIKRMSTLVSTVAGGKIFKEDALLRKTIACLIMIAGVTLIVI